MFAALTSRDGQSSLGSGRFDRPTFSRQLWIRCWVPCLPSRKVALLQDRVNRTPSPRCWLLPSFRPLPASSIAWSLIRGLTLLEIW